VTPVLHRDAQGNDAVKSCTTGFAIVTRKEVPGAGKPAVKAGTVVSTAVSRDGAKKLAEDMIAKGAWPRRSLKVIRVLNCLEK
jgi:hypothetical protein